MENEQKTVTHPAVFDMIDGRPIPLTPSERDQVEADLKEDRQIQAAKRGDTV